MKIKLNGEEHTVNEKTTISALLESFSLDKRKIAVEKNLEIVSRSKFDETFINDGDEIEIIHFIGGG